MVEKKKLFSDEDEDEEVEEAVVSYLRLLNTSPFGIIRRNELCVVA